MTWTCDCQKVQGAHVSYNSYLNILYKTSLSLSLSLSLSISLSYIHTHTHTHSHTDEYIRKLQEAYNTSGIPWDQVLYDPVEALVCEPRAHTFYNILFCYIVHGQNVALVMITLGQFHFARIQCCNYHHAI